MADARKGPPPLARPPAPGKRVRVGYKRRGFIRATWGPWFEGEVLERRGRVMKVRLDEAGVAYYVRTDSHWVDQELQPVLVAEPDTCAAGGACESGTAPKSPGRRAKPGARVKLSREDLAAVRRAQRVLRKGG